MRRAAVALDVRLPLRGAWEHFPDFEPQFVADLARDYSNIGIGFGLWH